MGDLRKALRKLARSWARTLPAEADASAIALGTAFCFVTAMLGAVSRGGPGATSRHLSRLLPEAAAASELVTRVASSDSDAANALDALLRWAEAHPGAPAELAAWLHQYVKEPWERAATSASLTHGEKIRGQQLRWATQFFTEPYMVRFLVRTSLESVDPQTVRVLDPACGGGNFLTEALAQLFSASSVPDPRERVDALLNERIVGFDLDAPLADTARLVLLVAGTRLCGHLPTVAPKHIYGGRTGDEIGFLDRESVGFVERAAFTGAPAVVVTNPPFLGRRLMSDSLRLWLRSHYPEAGADLCAAFVQRCVELLRPGDRCGLVHQTSWMYLSTFEDLRKVLHRRVVIQTCAELGANAFHDIKGEKTRVALTVLAPGPTSANTRFLDLADLGLEEKAAALEAGCAPPERVHLRPAHTVLAQGRAVRVVNAPSMEARTARLPRYGEFADPMQGTSTGSNTTFVRYAWEVDPSDPEWRPVSKGGGYCKWAGLNRYRVRWGEDGALVRANPGSAVRNLDRMARTHLVYSDTGTLGMNVRMFETGKVFIASGPGIEVREGSPAAHLAFLNSKLATYFMRQLSPKLTISAGYIRRLPFARELADDGLLGEAADRCVALKRAALSRRLGNDEYTYRAVARGDDLEALLTSLLLEDLEQENERLRLESEVEYRVREVLGLTVEECFSVDAAVGTCAGTLSGNAPSIAPEGLDEALAGRIDAGCVYASARGANRAAGCEGVLEALAIHFQASPDSLLRRIHAAAPALVRTRRRYLEDLLHQSVLYWLGYTSDRPWPGRTLARDELLARSAEVFDAAAVARLLGMPLQSWIREVLPSIHGAVFRQRPILRIDGVTVQLGRSS